MTTQSYTIDTSHSGIHFTVRHMVFAKVRGAFERWSGTFELDLANPAASKVAVEIDAASVDTREPRRDEHLRSADFLDVASHPRIVFASTQVARTGEDRFAVSGDLTVHGVTRPVTLEAELLGTGKDPWGNERVAFQARTAINRKEFGLSWNQVLETGGVLVGDKIEIAIDIEAVKSQAAELAA